MTHARPPLTKDLIDALVASAVGWGVRLLCVLLGPGAVRRARPLHRFVQRLERHVECIVFLKALMRMGPPPRRPPHPGSLAPGFRSTRGSVRHFFKSARIRARNATLIGRLARLIDALADSEAYVAHFMARLARGLWLGGIVVCAPPAVSLCADAPGVRAFADSS
ncbi:MAG: hypothetical protein ACREH4_16280 [Vitreimonas sp.]